MMKKSGKKYDDDDGRTIIDMSQIGAGTGYSPPEGYEPVPEPKRGEAPRERERRPWEDTSLTGRERRMYMLGALKATLFIALAYLAGFGLLIWLLLWLWD